MDKTKEQEKQVRKSYAKRGEAAQKMVSFRLDAKLMPWLNSKKNKGRYINELIAKDAKSAWVDV